jgi:hypothetical protein
MSLQLQKLLQTYFGAMRHFLGQGSPLLVIVTASCAEHISSMELFFSGVARLQSCARQVFLAKNRRERGDDLRPFR